MPSQLFTQISTQRVPVMDHIAAVAMKHFRVPIAIVSLLTNEEVVFVGTQGLPDDFVPRETSFCRLVFSGREVVVVEDARLDSRIHNHTAVLGPPFVRFLAGAPLMTDMGKKIGTICIADVHPRELAFGQRIALKHLARIASQEWANLTAVKSAPLHSPERSDDVSQKSVDAIMVRTRAPTGSI